MPKEILNEPIDVIEHKINRLSPALLKILLKDNTTKQNLRWATTTYEKNGVLYSPQNEMKPDLLINENMNLLTPRVSKTTEEQQIRTKQKGEVFTVAWMCNIMNNYLDEDWFGRKNVFNKEIENGWKTNKKKITFSKKLKKSWQDYVADIRIEIACGEAPYLVSRYDVVKGEIIPVENRIGILDRKLRVVNENTEKESDWIEWAEAAYKATYGYDFQGDNVLIARENLLYTLIDNMMFKFKHQPDLITLKKFANIISWNIWQMDGLDYTAPYSEREAEIIEMPLFVFEEEQTQKEKIPANIKNWNNNKTIEFKKISGGKERMKFDYIIGNPPYQKEIEGTSDDPVYNVFIDSSYELSDKVELITPARFLFNAGKTPKPWNSKMLNDKHLKVLLYEPDGSKIFPNTDIKGGVAITYHDKKKEFGAIEVFTAYEELNDILQKVKPTTRESLSEIVYAPESYKFTPALYKDHPEISEMTTVFKGKKAPLISKGHDYDMTSNIFEKLAGIVFFEEKPNDGKTYVQVFGRTDNSRAVYFINRDYVASHDNLDYYKLFFPKSNGSGKFGEPMSASAIGIPGMGHTQTFLSMGAFKTKKEAEALMKYVQTKFARTMLGILKVTQDNKKAVWRFVPQQDLSTKSDIDWSKSIAEIDQQLYKKYGLTQKEINFIESHVKEME